MKPLPDPKSDRYCKDFNPPPQKPLDTNKYWIENGKSTNWELI